MTRPLRILHCLRAPVGGLFRHVCDLVKAQAEAGHELGIICDSRTGGTAATESLDKLHSHCALGISRVPMSRQIGLSDLSATWTVRRRASEWDAGVLHGHGAKGGAYARLAARIAKKRGQRIFTFYTPHGGSLHYDPRSIAGAIFLTLERRLAPLTDGLFFTSNYAARLYEEKVAPFPCQAVVAPNGLWPEEFKPVRPGSGAADFVFVGELRHLKGVDVLLSALGQLNTAGKEATARIVGSGPDEARYQDMARELGLEERVEFTGAMPAREAFALGRCLVIPSRAESFPYIVLEAAAARVPMIVTEVGGIPEIVADTDTKLIPADDTAALATEMAAFRQNPAIFAARASRLQEAVQLRFQASAMANTILEGYERASRA